MKHDVGAAAAAEVAAVSGGEVGDLPPSRCPKEGVDMERSESAGDGQAVQVCHRDERENIYQYITGLFLENPWRLLYERIVL